MDGEEKATGPVRKRQIGSYRLLNPLGTGGMSSVFRAEHVETGLVVALKILPRSLAKNPTLMQRFLREAKSAEALEHSNIVAIYDRGVDEGRHYLVLEYVAGGDLHDWIRTNGPMDPRKALGVVRSVANGLKYAAECGLVHRDIKPANLLVTPTGEIKIADLGLALQAENEDERVTREGTTVGTVDFMAPEQARDSRATSIRSDIYSLGCTLFFLLTGRAPFSGGDVGEKLNRHCTAPPPDPREIRPDLPIGFTNLLNTMMAKKPENRYPDFDALSAALDEVEGVNSTAQASDEPILEAIVLAEEDDDICDSDDAIPLTLAAPEAKPVPARTKPDLVMADLAEFQEENRPRQHPQRPGSIDQIPSRQSTHSEVAKAPPINPPGREQAGFLDEGSDELALTGSLPAASYSASGRKMTESEKSWLRTCIFAGIGLVLFVIGVDQLMRAARTDHSGPVFDEPTSESSTAETVVPTSAKSPAVVNVSSRPASTPVETKPPAATPSVAFSTAKPKLVETKPAVPTISEPTDPIVINVAEMDYGPGVEERFTPIWALIESSSRLPGKTAICRRIPDFRDLDQKSSLRAALETPDVAMVELADNGPFFESELRFPRESTIIKARPGFRPILALDVGKTGQGGSPTAWLDLGEKSLLFDGLDLVLDTSKLPHGRDTIFQINGGSLTLRNCTITIVAHDARSTNLIRIGKGNKPSRLRISRCLVRGDVHAVADLESGAADVFITRTAIINGQGSAIAITGSTDARDIAITRSIVATHGPVMQIDATKLTNRARTPTVRVLGSTLARLPSAGVASLVASKTEGNAAALLNWQGQFNTFAGWNSLLAVGPSNVVRVPGIEAARSVWPGSDTKSEETSAWPFNTVASRVSIENLRELVPSRLDIASRIPDPSPRILEKTVDAFAKPFIPGLAAIMNSTPFPSTGSIGQKQPVDQGALIVGGRAKMARGIGRDQDIGQSAAAGQGKSSSGAVVETKSFVPGKREFNFDITASPWAGDVGRFLSETVSRDDRHFVVKVSGAGNPVWSPVRLPDGVSLEVRVIPNAAGKVPSWSTPRGVSAEALIELRNGSLLLEGVKLSRDGSARLRRLVRVERGHLILERCQFTQSGAVETNGGGLLAFIAPGSLDLATDIKPVGTWPFEAAAKRPTCRVTDSILITGGDVILAEAGRSLIAFWQCAIASGNRSFVLNPRPVARHRFENDLYLERCTVASEFAFYALGAWLGTEPGPDRPWLVTTQNSAFFSTYEKPLKESALLRVNAEAFAHASLLLQSSSDFFDVPQLALNGDGPGRTAPGRVDQSRQWLSLWGESHVRNISFGRVGTGAGGMRLVDRLKPGNVIPEDLAIDTDSEGGRRASPLGVDFGRLGLTPKSRPARRR